MQSLVAQQRTITGQVTGEEGNPLSDISVTALGDKSFKTVVTDASGGFSISVEEDVSIIGFSGTGFEE